MENQISYYESKLKFETDSWDLNEMISGKENIIIVDARSDKAFSQEHIPGAINIPHREMNETSTKSLDKSALIITYCDGIGCNASTKAALNMTRLGFQVKELLGGLDWWKRDGYPTGGRFSEAGKEIACGC